MKVYGSGGRHARGACVSSRGGRADGRAHAGLGQRDGVLRGAGGFDDDDVAEVGQLVADGFDLGDLAASSQTIATDSELPATHAHSVGELVG